MRSAANVLAYCQGMAVWLMRFSEFFFILLEHIALQFLMLLLHVVFVSN